LLSRLPLWIERAVKDFLNDKNCLPGEGQINWHAVADRLTKLHYHGVLMLRVRHRDRRPMPPEQFVKTAYDRAKSLERMLGQPSAVQGFEPIGGPHL